MANWSTAGNAGVAANFSISFHVDSASTRLSPLTTSLITPRRRPASLLTGKCGAALLTGPYARVYQPNAIMELRTLPTDPVGPPAFDYHGRNSRSRALRPPAIPFTVRGAKDMQIF